MNARSQVLTAPALGATIEARLEALDMPRKVFIRRVGMSNAYLSEILRGHKFPSLPMLIDLATALDVPTSVLMAHAERGHRDRGAAPVGDRL